MLAVSLEDSASEYSFSDTPSAEQPTLAFCASNCAQYPSELYIFKEVQGQ